MERKRGFEPPTLGVTGRYSNQLNYRTKNKESRQESNLSHHIAKKDCSTTELLDSLKKDTTKFQKTKFSDKCILFC